MDITTIEKTAICYWSQDDDCYLVSSTVFIPITAEGETQEEAWENFRYYVEDTLNSYINGNHILSPETPETIIGESLKTMLEADIGLPTKDKLNELAAHFSCSVGDIIDYLVGYHQVAIVPDKNTTNQLETSPADE